MEVTGTRIIRYGKEHAAFSIYDIADIHWGNRGCSKELLRADVRRIQDDPYALWVCGGDYCDWITPADPRFDPESVDGDLTVQDLSRLSAILASSLLRELQPIAGKCLGLCIGNHEHQYMRRESQRFIHSAICRQLGAPDMGFSGWADLYFCHEPGFRGVRLEASNAPPETRTARLRVYIHHGFGAAQTAGGKINALKRLVDNVQADLVMMSHIHEQIGKPFVRLTPDEACSEITQVYTMALVTGSYLKIYEPGYTSYGEIRGYTPTILGASRAHYLPSTMEIIIEHRASPVGSR